jgi:lysosomal Pro-X carboxypeptidase
MVFPMCSDGVNDMFEPEKWDYELYRQNCYDQFKIYPRKEFAPIYYGVFKILKLNFLLFSIF